MSRAFRMASVVCLAWVMVSCGGAYSPPPPTVSIVSITVSPSAATVFSNGTQGFTATVTGTNNTAATWSIQEGATGGSITSAGVYTAPQAAGTYHAIATSQADSTKSAIATVTVPSITVAISPPWATVFSNGTQGFTGMVTGTTNTAVTWSVQEGAAGGSITSAGVYTAPQAIGIYRVVATSQADNTKSAMATVNVPPISVSITPAMDTLRTNGSRDFLALVDGTNNMAVTWSIQEGAAGGTITPAGNYTAPVALGTYHVDATSVADASKSASAPVTVVASGFTPTGSPGTERAFPTATLLPDGKVLVTGGGTAELYDPATGRFTATGNMVAVRINHTATLLPNGKVLIAGGLDTLTSSGHVLASTELFDPATGSFTPNGDMGTPRASHTATLLANGKVLLAGGHDNFGNALASTELYDPASGIFTTTGSMTSVRTYHTATLLPNGKVLVAGGSWVTSVAPIETAELFDPASGTFAATGSMTSVRTYHTATLLPNGKVLVAGGLGQQGESLATAELFDPAIGTFTVTGGMGRARAYDTATLLPNGEVLVAGGLGASPGTCESCGPDVNLATAELFDPASGSFTATGSMGRARTYPTAALLQDGKVLVLGGGAELYH